MKNIFVSLFIFSFFYSFSQPIRFNKMYHPYFFSQSYSLQISNNKYYAIGGAKIAHDVDTPFKLTITEIDSIGSEGWSKNYGDSLNDWACGLEDMIYKTNTNGYILACTKRSTPPGKREILLLRLDDNFDTLWTKAYLPYDTLYEAVGASIQGKDGNFYLLGAKEIIPKTVSMMLTKTDTNGNMLWTKLYGADTNFIQQGFSIANTYDGDLMLAGMYNEYNNIFFGDGDLLHVDSAGNKKHEWYFGNPNVNDGDIAITATRDSGYIIYGSYVNTIGPVWSTPSGYGRIIKMNKDFEIVWEKQYIIGNYDTYITSVVELQNGDIAALYRKFDTLTINGYFNEQYNYGLMKTDALGNELWHRTYYPFDGDSTISFIMLNTLNQTPDGGFIMSGTAARDDAEPPQQMWVVKTDSMGYDKYYHNVYGTVCYNNTQNTPLANVKLFLKKQNAVVDSTITDASGAYHFNSKISGTYTIVTHYTKPWGGATATDALLIQRHIAGLSTLSEPGLSAADVNFGGSINNYDALYTKLRIAGISNSFESGDWYFNPQPFTIENLDVTINFKGLCYGDVNGSYIPVSVPANNSTEKHAEHVQHFMSISSAYDYKNRNGSRFNLINEPYQSFGSRNLQLQNNCDLKNLQQQQAPKVNLFSTETVKTNKGTTVEIPIKVTDNIETSAISLFLSYSKNAVEILSVTSVNSELIDMVTNIANGKLNIIWNRIQPISLHANDVVFTLNVRVLSDSIGEIKFELLPESEFANEEAQIIEGVTLEIPTIQVSSTNNVNSEKYSISGIKIIPNPAKDKVRIIVNETNAAITIFNAQGLRVFEKSIIKATEIDVVDWKSGVYVVKVRTKKSIFVGKMVKE